MKLTFLTLLLISFSVMVIFSSCGNGSGKADICDTNAIIRDYLMRIHSISKSDSMKFDKESFAQTFQSESFLPHINFPHDIPQQQAIDSDVAQAEIDLFTTYLTQNPQGDNNCDGSKITTFKFFFGIASTGPCFVIAAYDAASGRYIFLPKSGSPRGKYQVFDQIAPCPSVCPTNGASAYDGLYIGNIPAKPSSSGVILPPNDTTTPCKCNH